MEDETPAVKSVIEADKNNNTSKDSSSINVEVNPNDILLKLNEKLGELTGTLADLERNIYATEGTYLEETAPGGNLVRGWKGLLTSLEMDVVPGHYRYTKFKESERLFSKSSATSFSAVTGKDLLAKEEETLKTVSKKKKVYDRKNRSKTKRC